MDVPLGGLCFLMSLFVVDNGLPEDAKPKQGTSGSDDEARDGVTTPPARTVGDATVPEIPESINTGEKFAVGAEGDEEEIRGLRTEKL